MKTPTMNDIEQHAKAYDAAAAEVEMMMGELRADLDLVKRKHLPRLKRKAALLAGFKAEGLRLVQDAPELFAKPRTAVFHGVKVGFTSSVGQLVLADEQATVKLIKRLFKDRVDELVATKETVIKAALKRLSPADLARLGATIEGAGDVPTFEPTQGEIEKLISKLTEAMVESMLGEEAA